MAISGTYHFDRQTGAHYALNLVYDDGSLVEDPKSVRLNYFRRTEESGLFAGKHATERDDGKILSRTGLYHGESYDIPIGVSYRNVGEYLNQMMNLARADMGVLGASVCVTHDVITEKFMRHYHMK